MGRVFLVSFGTLLAVLVGLDVAADVRLPWWGPVPLYLAIYATVSALWGETRRATDQAEPQGAWPTSGPIGWLGQRGLVFTFTLSGLLCLLNPFQVVEIARQAIGNAMIRRRLGKEARDAPVEAKHVVRYSLPFRGEWFVYNGGVTPATSHSWDVLTQRYAYDFVVVDEELRRHRGRGTRVEDYYCHGQPILAAADGEVVRAEQRIRTAPWLGYGLVDVLARSFIGNHVVLRHADEEFTFYAHLMPGSVPVRVGDRVARGQEIGRCGHTGHSSEPHLHFHLQDRADFFTAAGLPIRFSAVQVDGVHAQEVVPRLGQRLRTAERGMRGR